MTPWITLSSMGPSENFTVTWYSHRRTDTKWKTFLGVGERALMTIQAVIWNWKNVKIVNSCTPSWGLAVTAVRLHCLMYTHAPSHLSFHYSNLQTAVSCTLGLAPCRPRYLLNTFFTPKNIFSTWAAACNFYDQRYILERGECKREQELSASL